MFWAMLLVAALAGTPLTNKDVAGMIAAGMPESAIVQAIELAARKANTDFDASAGALVALKEKGATEKVLNAVLAARAQNPVPGLPAGRGVYFRSGQGFVEAPSVLLWPPFFGESMDREEVVTVKIPAESATVKIQERSPKFYVRGVNPGAEWRLVRLEPRGNERRFKITMLRLPSPEVRFEKSQTRPIERAAVGGEVFSLQPAASLDPGQYALCNTVPHTRHLLSCHPFAIE